MRKLILEEWLSLDGFAVDKNGRLDFFPPRETDKFSDRDQLKFLDRACPSGGLTNRCSRRLPSLRGVSRG